MSSMSSRGRGGGGDANSDGGAYSDREEDWSEASEDGIIERVASWWQTFKESTPLGGSSSSSPPPTASGGGASSATTTTNNNNNSSRLPPGAVIVEPDDEQVVSPGCIGIFSASQALVAHKRFLRLAKPRAGSSFKRISSTRVAEKTAACMWEEADATTFPVRSKNYMQSKTKENAAGSIYKLVGVDMYSFDFKLYHIAQHIDLPQPPTLGPAALALPPHQQLPPLLIINLQLPTYAPSMFGGSDGVGQSLIYYFALPEGWEPSMVENQAALSLAQRFFNNGVEFDGQATRDRLKLLPRIVNVDEWALKGPLSGAETRLLRNYNGKPLLTRPQQRFYSNSVGKYLEIDVDVHSYAYIARRAFYGYISRLAPVVFENAFVVQGNRAEELPEVLLGCVRVHRVDFTKSRPFPAQSLQELGHGVGADGPPTSQQPT